MILIDVWITKSHIKSNSATWRASFLREGNPRNAPVCAPRYNSEKVFLILCFISVILWESEAPAQADESRITAALCPVMCRVVKWRSFCDVCWNLTPLIHSKAKLPTTASTGRRRVCTSLILKSWQNTKPKPFIVTKMHTGKSRGHAPHGFFFKDICFTCSFEGIFKNNYFIYPKL